MAQTIYYHAEIITLNGEQPEAIAVEGDRIAACGTLSQLRERFSDARLKDLKGYTMMPAFIDAHSHFTQVANSFLQVSLEGVKDCNQLEERIREYICSSSLKEKQWITAGNFDDADYGGYPTLEELDRAAKGHPLILSQKSGHMGMVNTAAMEALAICGSTSQIEGGKIERKDGHPTGYLEENAFFYYQKQVPMPSAEQFIQAFRKAQDLYRSYGIHTMQEGMLVKEMLPLYQLLLTQDLLELDLVAYPDLEAYPMVKELFADHRKKYHKHLRIGGIKIFLDGSPQGKTAWMRTNYVGTQDCGYGTMTDEQLLEAFYLAGKENVQILAHCNGDAACEQFLNCLERAEQKYPNLKEVRPVIIHAQLLGLDQIRRVKELGAMASFFAAHVYYFGDTHIRNFSLERAKEISPAGSALREGLLFTFHQDAPVILPDMWETIWCAVARTTKAGVILGAHQSISVLEAIKAVTKNAAYQYGEEKEKGILAEGRKADFILLSKNPLKVPVEELRNLSQYLVENPDR